MCTFYSRICDQFLFLVDLVRTECGTALENMMLFTSRGFSKRVKNPLRTHYGTHRKRVTNSFALQISSTMSRPTEAYTSILHSDFSYLRDYDDDDARRTVKSEPHKRTLRFSDDPDITRWNRPSSYRNLLETNSAPTIPLRRTSCDGSVGSLVSSDDDESIQSTGSLPTLMNADECYNEESSGYGSEKTAETTSVDSSHTSTQDDESSSRAAGANKKKKKSKSRNKMSANNMPANLTRSMRKWEKAIENILQNTKAKSISPVSKDRRAKTAAPVSSWNPLDKAMHVVSS